MGGKLEAERRRGERGGWLGPGDGEAELGGPEVEGFGSGAVRVGDPGEDGEEGGEVGAEGLPGRRGAAGRGEAVDLQDQEGAPAPEPEGEDPRR